MGWCAYAAPSPCTGGVDPASLVSEAQDVAGDLHQIAVAVLNCNCQRNKNVESVGGCWPILCRVSLAHGRRFADHHRWIFDCKPCTTSQFYKPLPPGDCASNC